MQREEFLEKVQRRAGLASVGEAERATAAVLEVLGEYLGGGEGPDLAAQLPRGIAETLRHEPPGRSEIFSLQDFLQRVGEQEGTNSAVAEPHTRAVFATLDEAVSGGEWDDVRLQFPSEFDRLFEE